MSGKGVVFIVLVVGFGIVCILWTVITLVYQAAVRPMLSGSGVLPTTAYDMEVLAWKAERAGRVDEAIELYIMALEMNPGNDALRQKLQGMTDKPLVSSRTTLRGVIAARLVDVPGTAWRVTDELPVLRAYVGIQLVATAHILGGFVGDSAPGTFRFIESSPDVQRMRFRWDGEGYGSCAEMFDYFARAITTAVTTQK